MLNVILTYSNGLCESCITMLSPFEFAVEYLGWFSPQGEVVKVEFSCY